MLVRDWAQGKPAAFDIPVMSPLTPAILAEASMRVCAAAERRKHTANDPKCADLCVSLAVETYYNWGEEATRTFALLVWNVLQHLNIKLYFANPMH